MKKIPYGLLIISLFFLVFQSCKKEDPVPEFVDPADVNLLSKVLIMPSGSERQNGNTPSSTGGSQAPVIFSNVTTVISSNGGTVPLSISYQNVTGNLAGCYVQVEGSNTYYKVPFNTTSYSSGRLSIPIGLPTNVTEGYFYVIISVYDATGRISNRQRVTVNVLRLGTGAIQISLSWDTPTDQDLWVTDPTGTKIYYRNKYSSSGGQLDRDDLDGYGPENIFWLSNAPDGQYNVKVNDYEYSSSTNNYYVTISTPTKTKTFSGTTIRGSTANVVTFTKSGDNYSF